MLKQKYFDRSFVFGFFYTGDRDNLKKYYKETIGSLFGKGTQEEKVANEYSFVASSEDEIDSYLGSIGTSLLTDLFITHEKVIIFDGTAALHNDAFDNCSEDLIFEIFNSMEDLPDFEVIYDIIK